MSLIEIHPDFYNIRGSFKIAKVIDIETQTSLVRLQSGRFVMLDAYTLSEQVLAEVEALTDGGAAIEAIVNLHPFHTLHVRSMAGQLPAARLYGTARHREQAPDLPWEDTLTEDPAMSSLFDGEFRFSVPEGLEFVHPNPDIHSSSVLAFHLPSRTLHVDDTLTWVPLPLVGGLTFHTFLGKALSRRPGAVADFRAWVARLIDWCEDVDRLCVAHARPCPLKGPDAIQDAVRAALQKIQGTLTAHEARWG